MAHEGRPTANTGTPARPAPVSGTPTSTARPSIAIRTPGSQGRGLRSQAALGLSASGRKPAPGPNATPHARAAFRTLDSRRAAILTPHRARRRSLRETRETPRSLLLNLGRVLAPTTEPITTSSSSPGSARSSETRNADTILEDDDDDEEELPKRPRLSLPLDADDDDDSPLRPHRSAGLEDENFTMQSIELPRRAATEQPRLSLASARMSDYYFNANELRSEDVGIDSGFFPQAGAFEEDNVDFDAEAYDRLDSDAARADMGGRYSDFGMVIPDNMNESTFVMVPQVQESPAHQPPPDGDDESMGENEPFDPWDGGDDDMPPNPDDDGEGGGDDDDQGHLSRLEDRSVSPDGGRSSPRPPETDLEATSSNKDASSGGKVTKRGKKLSKYGIEYPSLPPAVVKRLATTFAKTSGSKGKISPDALKAIMQASDWFFEQLGDDLQAYAKHAHRKTIDESDMLTLMKRQRQTNAQTTPFALAQRHLPRELLQELRMPPPPPTKRQKKGNAGAEGDEDVT
ncbi:centromere protein T [Rhypophila decipiens]|uniref:Centromere protein T n=1 Tax=Rhypophila decipiens TaxID=261697 RepID=A0AAN6Y232_9PEZI|nr:centromere protein T [Rhypophila decipiens]